MRIADMNWSQVENYLTRDDRCVLPVGSVEQHAQLSLCVDAILSEKVAVDAAAPLGVPVYPAMPFGVTPYFMAYPGTVSLRIETLLAVMRDLLSSLRTSGFRRILLVNGHGGNAPIAGLARELMADWPEMSIRYHAWWSAPRTLAKVKEIADVASHASWMENFPWTRLDGVEPPVGVKPLVDFNVLASLSPQGARELLGDGNFGGAWQLPDEQVLALWEVGVEETRAALEGPWPSRS